MDITGRLFLCARCRAQVLVCSHCDRGQIYCDGGCAQLARSASMREAGVRYQASRMGRFNHAARSRRYRARLHNVTHQGSPSTTPDALLQATPTPLASAPPPAGLATPTAPRCYFCGKAQPALVRTGPLRCRVRRPLGQPDRRGDDDGHSP